MKITGYALILLLGPFLTLGSAQNLRTAWSHYLSVDAKLNRAIHVEGALIERQSTLTDEMRALRENQSWYNGWINEMLLSRKSAAQAKLADSLQILRVRIADLTQQRDMAFLAFKRVYQQILLHSENGDSLSSSDKERAISIGRWIISRSVQPVELPDYTSIVASTYGDQRIRQLVLQDLLSVLEAKLTLIDSLLTERRSERELVTRLNEFHRDLGLQLETNRDLGSERPLTARATSEPAVSPDNVVVDDNPVVVSGVTNAEGYAAEDVNPDVGTYGSFDRSMSEKSSSPISGIENQITPEKTLDFPMAFDSIEDNMNLLESKRQQYRQLLEQIEKELAQ